MATVSNVFTYSYDYGNAGLQPGVVRWHSYGPLDAFRDSAIVMTAHPYTLVAGATYHRAMALQVSDTFVHNYPTVSGDLVFLSTHVGVWLKNTGQFPIRYITFKIAVMKA